MLLTASEETSIFSLDFVTIELIVSEKMSVTDRQKIDFNKV